VTAGITGATRVYLHLAHPSAHARTPQVMNAEFARRGVDAVAVSADVAPADLGGFARGLRGWRNLAGLSVTMPHKESLAAHVDELIGAAALIGAVNVVRRESDGRLVACGSAVEGSPPFNWSIRPARRKSLPPGVGGFSVETISSTLIRGCAVISRGASWPG
jgi:shikimate dehydrogenase